MRIALAVCGLSLLLSASPAFGHGGHDSGPSLTSPKTPDAASEMDHSGHAPTPAPLEEPVQYGLEGGDAEPAGAGTYGLDPEPEMGGHAMHQETPAEPTLFEDPLQGMQPAADVPAKSGGHSADMHAQHVEPSSYTRVTGDARGHGVAIGITIFSGLVFGLLSLIRPFE